MVIVEKRNLITLWKDVIFALLIRHIKSKFNDKFGVSWLIIQPVTFILALSFLRGRVDSGDVYGLPPFVFMMIGFVTVLQFIQGWSLVSGSIRKDKPLYAFRQVQPIASVVTTSLVEFITFSFVMLILSGIAIVLGQGIKVDNLLMLIIYMIEIQILSYVLGLIFAIGVLFIKEVNKIESILQRPLLFISGAFFSLNDMPEATWPYLAWNPLLQAIELCRHSVNNGFNLVSVISPTYLHLSTFFLTFIGFSVYYVFWKKAISR